MRYARENGIPASRIDDVAIAVSELVANAVVHAYRDRDTPGAVTVGVWCDDGRLVVRVMDQGIGLIPRTDSPGAGFGLQIAASVADDVRIEALRPGTAVNLTFAAAA
jgi:stage II sporulation protein AB (anti-sigma F factor)